MSSMQQLKADLKKIMPYYKFVNKTDALADERQGLKLLQALNDNPKNHTTVLITRCEGYHRLVYDYIEDDDYVIYWKNKGMLVNQNLEKYKDGIIDFFGEPGADVHYSCSNCGSGDKLGVCSKCSYNQCVRCFSASKKCVSKNVFEHECPSCKNVVRYTK